MMFPYASSTTYLADPPELVLEDPSGCCCRPRPRTREDGEDGDVPDAFEPAPLDPLLVRECDDGVPPAVPDFEAEVPKAINSREKVQEVDI